MRVEKLDSETRRGQFEDAALGLIATHGVEGLSLGAVARRLGLVPSAIYRHFKSKDDLIEAIIEVMRGRMMRNLDAVRAAHAGNALEALRHMLMMHVGQFRENQAIPRIIFSESLHTDRPDRRRRIHSIITDYLAGVADLIREGQRQGRIRADLDPSTAAVVFLGLIQSSGVLWILTDGGFDVTKHAQRAWRLVGGAFAETADAGKASKSTGGRRGVGKRK